MNKTDSLLCLFPLLGQAGEKDPAVPSARKPLRRASHLRTLEQRFMFDGAAIADTAHACADAAHVPPAPAAVEVRAAEPAKDNGRKEAVLIDTSLADYQTLMAGVREGVAIVEFDGSQDGLAQIARWAQSQNGFDAIHIFSHGSEGKVNLGTALLTEASLQSTTVQAKLAEIGRALGSNGDLLLYGCDIAAGTGGQRFLDNLAAATGADVAASMDATGSAGKGGNWSLEARSGAIDVRELHIADYDGLLATVSFSSSDGDIDYSHTSVTRVVGGRTFTFSGGSGAGGMGTDTSFGGDGLYAYEGTNGGNDIKLTISVENGYTFDIASFDVGVASGSLTIDLTFSDNSTTSFTQNGISTNSWTTLSSFNTAINDVKQIVLTSNNFGLFQNFDITDVKVIVPAPTVSDARISITSTGSGTGGAYKIGDTVTASWDNTGTGDNNSGVTGVTMNFSAFGGGAAVAATESSGTWTASYTIVSGSVDLTNRNVSVSATNAGGTTTTADTTNLTVDNVAPTVTDARISISGASGTGGAYKIGDTVTATWNNTAGGDNNSDTISGVTVDFSQFGGGAAVAATNSAGTWTATYTIVSGALDTTNRNVSVTATDNAGNTTTRADTTNATVDNVAPTVTDGNISISGASGTGGAYKIGDTVTATWNNTAGGDNNSDTISGVTVDFSQFGGGAAVAATNSAGTWTATYTIVAGALNGTTNRNVSVSATDNAGNATTTADTTNATVDNVAPSITFSGIAFSADTGSSSSDFITNTAAQTITATLSGTLNGGDIVYGSLDNGGTWTDITSKVSGTTLTWDGVTLTSSNTLRLRVTDAAGNNGTTASQAYTLDTSAPSAPSTPDMTAGTDTGSSSSDNITSNATPTFTGTAESGSTVTLYDTDGTTVLGTATATGGNWSITSSSLSAGSHTLTAKATDAAGNTSSASSGLSVAIDTAAPTGLGLNTTTIATQNATSTSTIATLSATDGQAITYALAVGNGTNDADNGSFSISGTSLQVGGASLSAGTYNIYVSATDAAGNVDNQAFTITIVDAPSVSSIVRAGAASATVNTSATSVQYTVTFSESVTGVDTSDFTLTATGTASGNIASISGSGSTYTVTVDTISGDGTLRLDLKNSGTGIQNGSSIAIASGYTSGSTYTLDHTAPNAPSTPDMTAGTDTGSSSTDNITNDDTPTFTGTAESGSTVTLYDTDGTTVLGTGTATGGNWSITSSSLSSGSHTITAKATDAAGNVSSASSGLSATIDTTAPTVSSVSVPSNGSYKAGQTLSFTVNTSEATTVDTGGGTPRLALTVGGSTVYADYASGSGSTALVFTYTVQGGDTDTDGIAVTALQSNGGTLRDTAGNSLNLTLNSVGSTASVLVDTTAPTVNSVSVPSNGTYYSNQNLDFTVNFSEAVTVNTTGGTPRIALTLDTGGTVYANYLSGSGTSALVFRYTVADGVQDTNGITVGALGSNGGTLKDTAGNDATLTLNSVGSTASVNVDGTQPRVTDVTSTTANGPYKAGDTVSVTITFSKAVTVDTTGGTPSLALGSGGTATYASGSGSSTLVFTYTVGVGQNTADLDYSATGSLSLNGGTIKDSGGAQLDAVLTLATPGAAGSLGANKDIVIDTTPPAITFSNLALSADTGSSGTDFITRTAAQTITATLSGAPTGSDIVYGSLDNGATWTDITSNVSGTTLTWNGVTLSGSDTLRLKVTDAAGNDGTVASQAYVLDTTAPGITFSNLALSADTGSSGTDFITRTAAQTITATLSGAPAGSDIVYGSLDNGATWTDITNKVSGTTLTWNGVTLSGSDTLRLKVTDAAGNDGTVASQAYVLDTTAPTTTIATVAFSADTGTSSTDFITKTAAQTISGTLSANLAAGEAVYVSLDNGATWAAASATVGQNTWSLSGQTLSASSTLRVKVADTAGNDGTVASQAYVLDTAAPGITFSNLALSADTGSSGTDFITRTAAQTITATLSGAPAGSDIVYGSLDNGATWTDITSKVSGTALAWNGVTLSGSDTLRLKVTDNAGNDGAVTSQAYVLDTTAPATTIATAAFSADTGVSATDFLVKTASQTISGTLSANVAAGETVYVSLDNGATWTAASTTVGQSTWSLAGQTLTGSNTLKIKVADAAGNDGAVHSQAYVLDTIAPVAPTLDALTTSEPRPTLTGTATLGPGESLTVTVGGATYAVTPSGGTWSLDLSSATPASGTLSVQAGNSYTITAVVTDAAGNTSTASGTLGIVVVPPVESARPAPPPPSLPPAEPLPLPTAPVGPSITFLSPPTESAIGPTVPMSGTTASTGPGATPPPTPVETSLPSRDLAARNTLTQGGEGSFRVVVVSTPSAAGSDGLTVNRGMADLQIPASGRTEISIPADAFAHTNPAAVVQLSAQMANGQPLPNWVTFDARNGKFVVQAPAGVQGEIAVRIVARDAQGHEAVTTFKIRVGSQGVPRSLLDQPPGRLGLSEQLRLAEAARQPAAPVERVAQTSSDIARWLHN